MGKVGEVARAAVGVLKAIYRAGKDPLDFPYRSPEELEAAQDASLRGIVARYWTHAPPSSRGGCASWASPRPRT